MATSPLAAEFIQMIININLFLNSGKKDFNFEKRLSLKSGMVFQKKIKVKWKFSQGKLMNSGEEI